jgi:MFS transporter, SP family, solute carrier family 2 (facilitated glucose transporter), member 3
MLHDRHLTCFVIPLHISKKVVFPGHGTAAWSLAVASFAAGAPFGAGYAGSKADERGRKSMILTTARLFLVGGLLQSLAPRLWIMALARFLIGFASGGSSVLIPIYLGELAPPKMRGTLGTVTQLATAMGILVSNVASFPLARSAPLWRLLFGVNVAVAGGILALGSFLLESPHWLLQRDEHSREARTILMALRNIKDERLLEVEVMHLLSADKTEGSGLVGSLTDIWNDRNTRSLLIGAVVLHTAQQLSGINAVFL